MLKISFSEKFRITDSKGVDRTPKPMKSRAMLAVLACEKSRRMTRAKLQDILWSDKEFKQASSSLRQSLRSIKASLGDLSHAIVLDESSVLLDRSLIVCDVDHEILTGNTPVEKIRDSQDFLHEFDDLDPELDELLQVYRSQIEVLNQIKRSKKDLADFRSELRIFHQKSDKYYDAIAANQISVFFNTKLVETDSPLLNRHALNADFYLESIQSEESLVFRITHKVTGARITSSSMSKAELITDKNFQRLNNFVDYFLFNPSWFETDIDFQSDSIHPSWRMMLLVGTVLRSGGKGAESAISQIEGGMEQCSTGVEFAWMAYLATYAVALKQTSNPLSLIDRAEQYARQAVERDPHSAVILALCSHVHSHLLQNSYLGLELACRAIAIDPNNPLAWAFKGEALLYLKQDQQAFEALEKARVLSGQGFYRHTIDGLFTVGAHRTFRFDQAIQVGETLKALMPSYTSPQKVLAASYEASGKHPQSEATVKDLQGLEPSFELDEFKGSRLMKDISE